MSESGYYPMGAEHDPRAPWNLDDAAPCETCDGTGLVQCPHCKGENDGCQKCGGHWGGKCSDCDGTGEGETPTERRMRLADEKADADMDRAKDERC